jgi:hypothetical protein
MVVDISVLVSNRQPAVSRTSASVIFNVSQFAKHYQLDFADCAEVIMTCAFCANENLTKGTAMNHIGKIVAVLMLVFCGGGGSLG